MHIIFTTTRHLLDDFLGLADHRVHPRFSVTDLVRRQSQTKEADMALKNIFSRQRDRTPRKPTRNWSADFSPRDWADLPTYHPRREDEAV